MTYPLYKQIQDPIVRSFFHHIYLNAHRYKYGWLQVNTGRTRSGKTETNILMATLLSRIGFNPDMIAFRPKDYLRVIDESKPGEPVVWTEMGTGLNSRQWQKTNNILTTEVMQMMMIKKPIVLMDVIDLGFVDVQVRKLARMYTEIYRFQDNAAYMKLFNINFNYRTGKESYHHPLIKVGSNFYKLAKIKISTRLEEVDKEIYDKFKKQERRYKDSLREKHMREMMLVDRELGDEAGLTPYIEKVKSDLTQYTNLKGNVNWQLVKSKLKIPTTQAQTVTAIVENDRQREKVEKMNKRLEAA